MAKLLVVVAAMIGMLFLINTFIPQSWMAGFNVPIGKGMHVPWALPILGGFFYIAWGMKGK